MKHEKIELVHGSGNVFRDFGYANTDVEQLKAILATEIAKMLDRKKLTVDRREDPMFIGSPFCKPGKIIEDAVRIGMKDVESVSVNKNAVGILLIKGIPPDMGPAINH